MTTELDRHQASLLLKFARKTIGGKLKGNFETVSAPPDTCFSEKAATFVTLKTAGQLRGCIGSLEATTTLWQSIQQNAINAAFHDSRFNPLSPDELEKIHIDISILTEPLPLNYQDAEDLVDQLRPGVDGVILQHGRRGATFLPQVWDQLPTAELFLSHLCRKAGLSEDCWQYEHPSIQVYQVQCFAEDE